MVSTTTARNRRRQRLRSTAVPTLRGTANATLRIASLSCVGRNCTLTGPDRTRRLERRSSLNALRPRTGRVRGARGCCSLAIDNAVPNVVRNRNGAAGWLRPTAEHARGGGAPEGQLVPRAWPFGAEIRAFSLFCGCWVGTSASSQPRFVVPVPRVGIPANATMVR